MVVYHSEAIQEIIEKLRYLQLLSSYICEWIKCLKLYTVYLRKDRHLIRFTYYKMQKGALSHLSVAISANGYTVSNYALCKKKVVFKV